MRPFSLALMTAVAVAAAASGAGAQDRYSARGVVYQPQASVYTDPSPAGLVPQRASYSGRMLSWPGKVEAPRGPAQRAVLPPPPQAPAQQMSAQQTAAPRMVAPRAQPAPPPMVQARATRPAGDRYGSINSRPDTAPRTYAPALRPEAPAQASQSVQREAPVRQAALTQRPQPAPEPRAPLPQSIYEQPARVASAPPPPARAAAPAPAMREPDPSFDEPAPAQFAGPYPPATKEPWRRLLGETPPQSQPRGVAVPVAPVAQAPAAPAKAEKPAKKAEAQAKPAKTAEAAPPPAPVRQVAPVVRTASAPTQAHFYSVHRQFGVRPDPIKMPQQFFLDGSPDLSEPPPPTVRRIAPSPGKSTAAQRAQQERSQQSPDVGG